MMATTDRMATRAPVLTRDGRAWVRARQARIGARLDQIAAELAAERSEDLLRERWQLTEQADELAKLLDQAVAPQDVRDDPTIVELGDEVEVELPDGSRESFLIVHPVEAVMDEHRTSSEAPLAKAVLGRRPGDRVTVETPAGVYGCTIIRRDRID